MSLQFDLNASPPSPVSDAVYSPDALLSSAPSSPSKPLAAQQNTLLATSSTSESSDVTGHGHVASTPYMRHLRRSSLQGVTKSGSLKKFKKKTSVSSSSDSSQAHLISLGELESSPIIQTPKGNADIPPTVPLGIYNELRDGYEALQKAAEETNSRLREDYQQLQAEHEKKKLACHAQKRALKGFYHELRKISNAPPSVPLGSYKALGAKLKKVRNELNTITQEVEQFRASRDKPPGDRLCGETACLSHLPSLDELYTYNRQVTPFKDDGLGHVVSALSTADGVDANLFWKAFDQCNCGQYFTKNFLNSSHGPICPNWPYNDTPAPPPEPALELSPFTSDLSKSV